MALKWRRGESVVNWAGEPLAVPGALLWAAEAPDGAMLAFVTQFDERTPDGVPNGYLCDGTRAMTPINIIENGAPVRFLGCCFENARVVFDGANEFRYFLDSQSLEVCDRKYFR